MGWKERKRAAFGRASPSGSVWRPQRTAFARDRRRVKPGNVELVELEGA